MPCTTPILFALTLALAGCTGTSTPTDSAPADTAPNDTGDTGGGDATSPFAHIPWVKVGIAPVEYCGLRANGYMECRGRADYLANVPTDPGLLDMAVGGVTCVLDADGVPTCWDHGRVFDPVDVPPLRRIYTFEDNSQACGLEQDADVLHCWENLDIEPRLYDPRPAASYDEGCKLMPDTTVECVASPATPGLTAVDVRASKELACTRELDHTITCWERFTNWHETNTGPPPLILQRPFGDTKAVAHDVRAPYTGASKVCIVTEAEGDVVCWRSNADTVPEQYPVPEFDEPQNQVVLHKATQCSIGVSGAITCWGERVPDPPFVYDAGEP